MSRLKQLESNIDYVVGEYYNGMMDDPDEFPIMNAEECVAYVKDNIYDMKVVGSSCHYQDGICNDLKFLGDEVINAKILELAVDILK